MEIKLNPTESEKYFHNALCNGLDYMGGYGLAWGYTDGAYTKAKETLTAKIEKGEIPHEMYVHAKEKPTICREDVYMEILRNGDKLIFIDNEGDGEYTREVSLKDVHERVMKTPIRHLTDMIEENDDATTADVILQTVFFEDIIFG